jgi:hypothetical protein
MKGRGGILMKRRRGKGREEEKFLVQNGRGEGRNFNYKCGF